MAEAILPSCGVYAIRHIASGKAYVGSARNIERRWKRHLTDLNCGRHHSAKLQRAWAKYGALEFEFVIIESVANEAHLIEREQHWIDLLVAHAQGFNSRAVAANCLGVKHSAETRAKVSAKAREAWADPEVRQRMINARMGRALSAETRAKIALSQAGKTRPKQSAETLARRAKTVRERLDAGLITMRADVPPDRLVAMNAASRTPEAIEKRRRALTGKKQSPEAIAKRAATLRERYKNDPELLARVSQSRKGMTNSRESIEKMLATRAANKAAKLASLQIALPEID